MKKEPGFSGHDFESYLERKKFLNNRFFYEKNFSWSYYDISVQDIAKFIENLGYERSREKIPQFSGHSTSLLLIAPDSDFVSMTGTYNQDKGSYYCFFRIVSGNKQDINKLTSFLAKHRLVIPKKGDVYVLTSKNNELTAINIGSDYHELERDNYEENILLAHDKVVEEFSKEECNGFISIFRGPPGTGKTYLIRSMIGKIDSSIFLYLPASLIHAISGPQLIGVFNSIKKMEDDQKICLILEDADEVLAPRTQTNMGGISTLLNLTDGILGRLLKIRVIATTNSPAQSLDPAIIRPGRLLACAEVGPLPYEQSKRVFERIGGEGELPVDKYTLSEIYYGASNPEYLIGRMPNKGRVGF